ncbi:YcaO-like family protein [Bacillus cytotoxicus]|uniref:YcaO-like family protein n=1 Tax=Bacillus cytotoxicus TaxID=580165 RepID=UPI000863FEEB|nr:YcaO-like family protein [Bacillus cytotoxicus]AWC30337.1 hypothetical protein CG483_019730 [Bacillus cytotoxicus]AWC42477.1 hypothetical protein CG480_019750 [Bacillus cytotoxicus]AWC50408.1 hypothetical protein CG478_019750 [Bacillus cytotoxicus]AWC54463.1 hypothetical protein CG477_019930 [Bacillus cytotoxicus]AWC58587.1 hypothetical protein CG476_019955 [Bacillus cytotoxicus]
MSVIKANDCPFIDERYGLIKTIYNLPSYHGMPRVYVKMAFGGNYSTAGFNASGAGITSEKATNSAVGEYIERYSCLHSNSDFKESGETKIPPSIFSKLAVDDTERYSWISAKDIIRNREVNIPADAVFLTYRSPDRQNKWIIYLIK